MKRKSIIIFLLPLIMSSCSNCEDSNITLVSFNIRYDNPDDGENIWDNRKDWVASLLDFHEAEIICLQEALHNQIIDLLDRLPNFNWVGLGRDDGKQLGEYSPIFYNINRFELLDWGCFWLSETPIVPSIGWDAACIRICTHVKLKDKKNNKEFFVFNTHLDHIGAAARTNSVKLILKKIEEVGGDNAVILAGDFNALPETPELESITRILNDTYRKTQKPPYGPVGTWNAFDYNNPLDQRIDYIFVSSHFEVSRYANITDARNQRFPSDHLPVLVRLVLTD